MPFDVGGGTTSRLNVNRIAVCGVAHSALT